MINMKFTLKELRARKNKTQQQSAKALGISVQTYNAWEQDISNVAISKVMKVADHFNVTLAEIKVQFFAILHEYKSCHNNAIIINYITSYKGY